MAATSRAETINVLSKADVIHRRSWKNQEGVRLATLHWFNQQGFLELICNSLRGELKKLLSATGFARSGDVAKTKQPPEFRGLFSAVGPQIDGTTGEYLEGLGMQIELTIPRDTGMDYLRPVDEEKLR